MKRIVLTIAATTLLSVVSSSVSAQPPRFHSGMYESLMVAVDRAGVVEGYLSEKSGDAFSCSFYLKGKLELTGIVHVQTWSETMKPGFIGLSEGGVILAIEGARDYSGCANVLIPEIETGVEYTQTRKADWIGLVTISAEKAFLMATTHPKSKHKGYIVKGDVVGVLGYQDGWAQVEFISDQDRSFTGWIDASQYQAIKAP